MRSNMHLSPDIHSLWGIFAALLYLLASGCRPMALPPPLSLPTGARQLPVHNLEASAGTSVIYEEGAEGSIPIESNPFSSLVGGLGYGITDRLDVALLGARTFGPYLGVQFGYRFLERDGVQVGVTAGMAGARRGASYSVQNCENAEAGCIEEDFEYHYFQLAPNLGLRTTLPISSRLELAAAIRGTYAFTATLDDPTEEMDREIFLEPGLGLTFSLGKDLRLGLGIGTLASPFDGVYWMPHADVSLSYAFPIRKLDAR